jgi:DNA ligase-1
MFKPMLAATVMDVSTLRFPLLASQKFDGIRATVQEGALYSRKLKLIPNRNVQDLFRGLPDGLDGELILGDPFDPACYRDTMSLVMSDDKPLNFFKGKHLNFWVFDKFSIDDFVTRESQAIQSTSHQNVVPVPHCVIHNVEELENFETNMLAKGAEGVILRSVHGRYKQGRSTLNEGLLIKLKRFKDCEAVIEECFELEHNGNEATVNELGRTHRSSHKANKTGLDTLGGFIVKGLRGDYNGITFRVGTGFDNATRKTLWGMRNSLRGQIIKVKYFPTGGKTAPRHPIYLGFRDSRDN